MNGIYTNLNGLTFQSVTEAELRRAIIWRRVIIGEVQCSVDIPFIGYAGVGVYSWSSLQRAGLIFGGTPAVGILMVVSGADGLGDTKRSFNQ